MKALGYEALLNQDEGILTASYPHGAMKTSGGKWAPSETVLSYRGVEAGDHRSLKELLKDKRARQEKPSYLRSSYSIPKPRRRKDGTWADTGTDDDNYTMQPGAGLRDHGGTFEPEERVPEDVQRRFSEDARVHREITHAEGIRRATMRSRLAILRQLGIEQIKAGKDPTPELDQAITNLRKAA